MVPHLYCFSIFFQSSHFSLIHHQSTSPFLCFWTRATVAKSGVTFASLPKYVQKSSSPTPGGRGRWGGGILGLGGGWGLRSAQKTDLARMHNGPSDQKTCEGLAERGLGSQPGRTARRTGRVKKIPRHDRQTSKKANKQGTWLTAHSPGRDPSHARATRPDVARSARAPAPATQADRLCQNNRK